MRARVAGTSAAAHSLDYALCRRNGKLPMAGLRRNRHDVTRLPVREIETSTGTPATRSMCLHALQGRVLDLRECMFLSTIAMRSLSPVGWANLVLSIAMGRRIADSMTSSNLPL